MRLLMLKHSQRGFTLVELSIVLVIIGLIIGGVLTGQQIIQNARITNAVNGIQAYQAQFQTYAQNYGALPGDDPSAVTRFPSTTGLNNGNNDGKVGNATSFDTSESDTVAGESRSAWAHLRAAGLVKNQATGGQPVNPFSGVFGFQTGAFAGAFTTAALCLDQVSAGAAQAIDARLDDGVSNNGMIRGGITGNVNTAAVANYGNDNTYVLCVRM